MKSKIPRTILCPGFVISKTDGDRHYISARELARLYCVRLDDCLIDDTANAGIRGIVLEDGDIRLYPRIDGNYPALQRTRDT